MLAECKSAFPKQYKDLYLLKACYLVCQGKKLLLWSFFLFSFRFFFSSPPVSLFCLPSPSFLPSSLTLNIKTLSTTSALLFLTLTLPRGVKLQGSLFFFKQTSSLLDAGPWMGTFSWPCFPSVHVSVCACVYGHVCTHTFIETHGHLEGLCGPSSSLVLMLHVWSNNRGKLPHV